MQTGREFSSWESFQKALDQYSQENKVVYIVGTCKPVETVNKNEFLLHKFPEKFKYCFARMVCKHYGNYSTKSLGQRPNQRTCKTGCSSSILVSVNKKRTGLVIKEADLHHSHAVSESIFSAYSQTRHLQGDERHMASVLLRAGVPLHHVQKFISHSYQKDPTIKDLQNLRSDTSQPQGALDEVAVGEFSFLNDLDKLMAEDSQAIVEIINFDLAPGAIYIQTSTMMNSLSTVCLKMLQVVTHSINDGKVSVVSIIGLDSNKEPQVLAFCVILMASDSALRCFFEAFVRNNSEICDCINGVILDCCKENAEFFQQLIPQAQIAWSRSYIFDAFVSLAKSDDKDMIDRLLDAETEDEYEKNLKCLMNVMKVSDYKEFLNTWDASKELWAYHVISSFPHLRLQKASIEIHYLELLKVFLQPQMSTSALLKALLRFARNEDPGNVEDDKPLSFQIDSSCKLYQELCYYDAFHATQCQIAIALNSTYEINPQTDMIFIKRTDSEEEFILNISGKSCTCPYFLKEELPCQHIFAWLRSLGKSLYDESLIPLKWQVFGSAVTLDAIAESLAQGHIPSSLEYDERIKELQSILKDLLATSCTHSYQQMGRDLALLRQVLFLMRTQSTHNAKLVLESDSPTTNSSHNGNHETTTPSMATLPARKPGRPPGKRGRGRPSHKEKLLRMMQEAEEGIHLTPTDLVNSTPAAKRPKVEEVSPPNTLSPCHNLRQNIKHKFVSSDVSSRIAPSTTLTSSHNVINDDMMTDNVVNIEEDESKVVTSVLNSDQTEMYRNVLPKSLLPVPAENSLLSNIGVKQSIQAQEKLILTRNQDGNQRTIEEDKNDEDDEDNSSDSSEDSDEDAECQESKEERIERRKQDLAIFLNERSPDLLSEVLQTISIMDYSEDRQDKRMTTDSDLTAQPPSQVLINDIEDIEEVDFVSSYLSSLCPGLDEHTYQEAACLLCKADSSGVAILSMLQSLNPWPDHLPDFPSSRPFEGEVTLDPGQTLTLCGHKLDQEDMDSLRVGKEITSETVHAYLEILAQKHSGKMFVLPFSVVHMWRNGTYTDMLFKKVHFKTFDFLVLPIHCGGEFSQAERDSVDMQQSYWMALVADVRAKTVSVLNPRTEDRYAVAANGYMLQWRRYMQIRSVHTREMLSAWTTKHIECNKTDREAYSAVMLLMNIEALICGVPPVVMHPMIHASSYRHHIAACLRDTDWQTTVLCVGGPECQRMAARDADWVQCENCRTWWHRACASDGINGTDGRKHPGKAGIFYCTSCRQRIQALGNGEGGGTQVGQRDEEDEDLQEEDNLDEDEGEEDYEEGEGDDEEKEDCEGVMKIHEIPDGNEDGEVRLILGTATEMEAEEN